MSEIKASRDIFDFRFVLKSDIDPKDIKYTVAITAWEKKSIKIFVNFTNPLAISQGDERDTVYITIKNPAWFKSKSGQQLDTSALVFKRTIPRQLPKSVN